MARRDQWIHVRVRSDELEAIQARAEQVGLPVSSYVRESALGHRLRSRPGVADEKLLYEIAKLGNNLNQLTRLGHQRHLPESDAILGPLEEVHDLLREVRQRLAEDLA